MDLQISMLGPLISYITILFFHKTLSHLHPLLYFLLNERENLLKNLYTSSLIFFQSGQRAAEAIPQSQPAWRHQPALAHLSYGFQIMDIRYSFWVPLNFDFRKYFQKFSFIYFPFSPHYFRFRLIPLIPIRESDLKFGESQFSHKLYSSHIFFR